MANIILTKAQSKAIEAPNGMGPDEMDSEEAAKGMMAQVGKTVLSIGGLPFRMLGSLGSAASGERRLLGALTFKKK